MPTSRGTLLSLAVALLSLAPVIGCGELEARQRYFLARDPASRHGLEYVKERQSGQWVHRQVEVRVSLGRPLPDPLTDIESGDRLHSQDFTATSVGTGDMSPGRFVERDGYRVWRFTSVPDDNDLRGERAFGVQIEWPNPGGPSTWESMEIFAYPPPGDLTPGTWTEWTKAIEQRSTGFAWLNEVTDQPREEAKQNDHPFEIRWRFVLVETPGLILDEPWGE